MYGGEKPAFIQNTLLSKSFWCFQLLPNCVLSVTKVQACQLHTNARTSNVSNYWRPAWQKVTSDGDSTAPKTAFNVYTAWSRVSKSWRPAVQRIFIFQEMEVSNFVFVKFIFYVGNHIYWQKSFLHLMKKFNQRNILGSTSFVSPGWSPQPAQPCLVWFPNPLAAGSQMGTLSARHRTAFWKIQFLKHFVDTLT